MSILQLDLALNPVPLARARVANGHAWTPKRSAIFQNHFRWELVAAGVRAPIAEPLALTLAFWRQHKGNNRGDLSNLIKAVEDSGNGHLWVDDRQIVEIHARFVDAGPKVAGRILIRCTYPFTPAMED